MSHVHWDHIMGFPFFMPAYLPGNHVRIYGCHAALEEAFRRQNAAPSFPVDFSRMAATIEFVRLDPGRDYEIAACGSGPSCSATRAIRTAIGSSRRARRWSTPPTPSTSWTTRR